MLGRKAGTVGAVVGAACTGAGAGAAEEAAAAVAAVAAGGGSAGPLGDVLGGGTAAGASILLTCRQAEGLAHMLGGAAGAGSFVRVLVLVCLLVHLWQASASACCESASLCVVCLLSPLPCACRSAPPALCFPAMYLVVCLPCACMFPCHLPNRLPCRQGA